MSNSFADCPMLLHVRTDGWKYRGQRERDMNQLWAQEKEALQWGVCQSKNHQKSGLSKADPLHLGDCCQSLLHVFSKPYFKFPICPSRHKGSCPCYFKCLSALHSTTPVQMQFLIPEGFQSISRRKLQTKVSLVAAVSLICLRSLSEEHLDQKLLPKTFATRHETQHVEWIQDIAESDM